MSEWNMIFLEPTKVVLTQISQFLGNLLLVILILIAGWFLSKLIKTLVLQVLKALKLDKLSEKIELKALLSKGGITYTLSELIAVIIYWLSLLVTVVVAVNAVGLTFAADLLKQVVLYVPNVIAALFLLVLGMFMATLLRNIVLTAANNAGLAQARLLSKAVETIVFIFALLVSLEQLGIAQKIIELCVGIVLASCGLGLALAFGLGCKDIAAKYACEFFESIKNKK